MEQVEARPLEADVGLVQAHVAALGDLPGLAQVGRGGLRVAAEAAEGGTGKERVPEEAGPRIGSR